MFTFALGFRKEMFNITNNKMTKYINRFKVLLILWAIVLCYCVFISTDIYFNGIAIFCGFCAFVLGFAYVEKSMTENEERFFNKIIKLF